LDRLFDERWYHLGTNLDSVEGVSEVWAREGGGPPDSESGWRVIQTSQEIVKGSGRV